jgi:hypothetical protein
MSSDKTVYLVEDPDGGFTTVVFATRDAAEEYVARDRPGHRISAFRCFTSLAEHDQICRTA